MFLRKFLEGKNILVICHHKNLLRAHPVSANLDRFGSILAPSIRTGVGAGFLIHRVPADDDFNAVP
jgi:hypothetical protein